VLLAVVALVFALDEETLMMLGAATFIASRVGFASVMSFIARQFDSQQLEPIFFCSYLIQDETPLKLGVRDTGLLEEPGSTTAPPAAPKPKPSHKPAFLNSTAPGRAALHPPHAGLDHQLSN